MREQHRRQRPLHVVGAAADQPVALDPRLELLRPPGDDVEVAVEDDGRAVGGPDLGDRHRQVADADLARLDLARLEPALDEPGGEPDPLRLGGVVGDQLLGERLLVHRRSVGAGAPCAGARSATCTRRSRNVSARAFSRSAWSWAAEPSSAS